MFIVITIFIFEIEGLISDVVLDVTQFVRKSQTSPLAAAFKKSGAYSLLCGYLRPFEVTRK